MPNLLGEQGLVGDEVRHDEIEAPRVLTDRHLAMLQPGFAARQQSSRHCESFAAVTPLRPLRLSSDSPLGGSMTTEAFRSFSFS